MRKADPNNVVVGFQDRTFEALADWRAIDAAIAAHASDSLRLRRRVASDSLLALLSSWESFYSEWMIAAVNRDPSAAAIRLADELTGYATGNLGIPADVLSQTLLSTSHLKVSAVRGILEPDGFNIAVRDHKELRRHVSKWLAGPYKKAASTVTAYQLMPAIVGRLVRNALAHQSQSALSNVNGITRQNTVPQVFRVDAARRNLDVRALRAYLLQTVGTPAVARIEAFHIELRALAGRFQAA